jgi:hypothetical protein
MIQPGRAAAISANAAAGMVEAVDAEGLLHSGDPTGQLGDPDAPDGRIWYQVPLRSIPWPGWTSPV